LDKAHIPTLNLVALILRRLKADLSKFGVGILETPLPYAITKKMREIKHPIPPAGESRFALLRLILNRNAKKKGELMIKPEVFKTEDIPYNCGRLLAVFSLLQKAAHRAEADGKRKEFEGAGVVERYYGAASTAPNRTFAVLWKLHHNHLQKLSAKGESGRRAARSFEKRIEEIVSLMPQTTFQSSFNLQEQGRFALGFYQQKAFERQQLNERMAARKAQQRSDAAASTVNPDEADLDELLSGLSHNLYKNLSPLLT
jgi:CRISPR-associated protein Csd1